MFRGQFPLMGRSLDRFSILSRKRIFLPAMPGDNDVADIWSVEKFQPLLNQRPKPLFSCPYAP